MTSWGTPILGSKTKVSEDHELKEGDRVSIQMFHGATTINALEYTNPHLIIDELRQQFQEEGHFQPKYIKVRFENVYPIPFGVTCDLHVETQAIVLHASPLVISVSTGVIILALIILAIVITVAVWSYYIFEKLGVGGGLAFFGIIAVIFIVIFMLITGRGRKEGG